MLNNIEVPKYSEENQVQVLYKIIKLRDEYGNIITDRLQLVCITEKFYRNLYEPTSS